MEKPKVQEVNVPLAPLWRLTSSPEKQEPGSKKAEQTPGQTRYNIEGRERPAQPKELPDRNTVNINVITKIDL